MGKEFGVKGCGVTFSSKECYEAHKQRQCAYYMICKFCHKADRNNGNHKCGTMLCRRCHVRHEPRKYCYITPRLPRTKRVTRILVMDGECRLCGMVMCDGSCLGGHEICAVEADAINKRYLEILRYDRVYLLKFLILDNTTCCLALDI